MSEVTSQRAPFRVIITGAGVTGLVAAHCLAKAGIDYVLIERRKEVAPAEGASISIFPHGARILQQIGLYDTATAACTPLSRWKVRQADGKCIMDNGFFDHIRDNHGSDMLVLERREYLEMLYENIPDKSCIKTGTSIQKITHLTGGVEVQLSNGETEIGDMVLGCDGAYSMTRTMMWEHAARVTPGLITIKDKTVMRTQWKTLLGVAPMAPELGVTDATAVSYDRRTFLAFSQPDFVYFFFIFPVDEPFTWPKRVSYTDADAEKLAESVASNPISDTLTFGELWKRRIRGGLLNLEEGVLEHWHSGRIVLAGDSAAKITPNLGLGGNSGMESAAKLVNNLNALLKSTGGQKPSAEALDQMFEAYQAERKPRMKEICDLCSEITKIQAWDSPFHKFMGNWVFPLQSDNAMANTVGNVIQGGSTLDFADQTGFRKGKVAYKEDLKGQNITPTSASSLAMRFAGGAAAVLLATQASKLLSVASAAATQSPA